jgi:anti-sigma B factor antagonist
LKIEIEPRGEVSIVSLRGTLAVGPECQQLHDTLQRQFAAHRYRLVLDLDGLQYIDSAGLGQLVALRRAACEAGGGLVLCRPKGKVRDVLALTRLDELLPVHDQIDQAVAAVHE